MTESLQVNFLLLIRANGKAHVQGVVCQCIFSLYFSVTRDI